MPSETSLHGTWLLPDFKTEGLFVSIILLFFALEVSQNSHELSLFCHRDIERICMMEQWTPQGQSQASVSSYFAVSEIWPRHIFRNISTQKKKSNLGNVAAGKFQRARAFLCFMCAWNKKLLIHAFNRVGRRKTIHTATKCMRVKLEQDFRQIFLHARKTLVQQATW